MRMLCIFRGYSGYRQEEVRAGLQPGKNALTSEKFQIGKYCRLCYDECRRWLEGVSRTGKEEGCAGKC